ncbi:MAG: hypothetical protein R3D89_05255 [Sphingomonadaceae bacterium]
MEHRASPTAGKHWSKPQLARLGRMTDVSGQAATATQITKNGTNPGS